MLSARFILDKLERLDSVQIEKRRKRVKNGGLPSAILAGKYNSLVRPSTWVGEVKIQAGYLPPFAPADSQQHTYSPTSSRPASTSAIRSLAWPSP